MTKGYCLDCGKKLSKKGALRCHKHANWIITSSFVGKKLSKDHKAKLKASWNYSKHITPEWRKKQSELRKGIPVNPKGSKWSVKQRKNIMLARSRWTEEYKAKRAKKISEALRGKKSYSWKGGITALADRVRSSPKQKRWSKGVIKKDDYTCQKCKKRGGYLHADHIKPFALILENNNIKTYKDAYDCSELWELSNGRTLCRSCHMTRHKNLVVDNKNIK